MTVITRVSDGGGEGRRCVDAVWKLLSWFLVGVGGGLWRW